MRDDRLESDCAVLINRFRTEDAIRDNLISFIDENGVARVCVFEPMPLDVDTIKRPERDQQARLNSELPATCSEDIDLVSEVFGTTDVLRGTIGVIQARLQAGEYTDRMSLMTLNASQ